MKFCVSTDVGTWTNWSTFEPDPDHRPDAGTGKSEIESRSVKQVPHSEQATCHGMHYREILFTPRCSPRASECQRSAQLFNQIGLFSIAAKSWIRSGREHSCVFVRRRPIQLRSYGASKLPNFRILAYFHCQRYMRSTECPSHFKGVRKFKKIGSTGRRR